MVELSWSNIAFIIYFSVNIVLLIVISCIVRKRNDYSNKTQCLSRIHKMRSFYATVIIHIYDMATDIGVFVNWGMLAYDGNDYESIDMFGLFWTAISFAILYRMILVFIACIGSCQDYCFMKHGFDFILYDQHSLIGQICCCCYPLFGLLDCFILNRLIQAMLNEDEKMPTDLDDYTPPRVQLRGLRIIETTFESIPEIILQSVFLIKSMNDERLRENSSIGLVTMSLIASLISISYKFVWIDKFMFAEKAEDIDLKKEKPCKCLNWYYMLRMTWRISTIIVRFVIYCLMWCVVGGVPFVIFLVITVIIGCCLNVIWDRKTDAEINYCCVPFIEIATIEPIKNKFIGFIRIFYDLCGLSIVTVFALIEFDCELCADGEQRQASGNQYILTFLILGWISCVIHGILWAMIGWYGLIEISEHGMMSNILQKSIENACGDVD